MKQRFIYTVYVARFTFIESQAFKVRPVIVISSPVGPHEIIAVIPVSSQLKIESGDLILEDWKSFGLKKRSVARIHRISSIARGDLIEKLGELNPETQHRLAELIKQHLHLESS
ncbi:type II toxin-antitoxin system PemK/MazF family toxin [Candidatus Saccharibacteria bacterium]|nr:type II toxin-antitoxin system PemK/MazF family toxin [Candidatus Saccharibacteria bacterium]